MLLKNAYMLRENIGGRIVYNGYAFQAIRKEDGYFEVDSFVSDVYDMQTFILSEDCEVEYREVY